MFGIKIDPFVLDYHTALITVDPGAVVVAPEAFC